MKRVRSGAIGYVRVSTEEQSVSGLGLAAQEAAIRDECERRDWQLLDLISDAGISGKSLRRPGMAAVLDRLGQPNGPAFLMAAKLDRLSRSMLDFAGLVERAQREGWALVVLDLGLDLSTPQGRFTAHVLSAVAELERGLIGQRTSAALAVKRARGELVGRPVSIPEPTRARIATLRASGLSLRAVAARLDAEVPTARGGVRWSAETVRKALRGA